MKMLFVVVAVLLGLIVVAQFIVPPVAFLFGLRVAPSLSFLNGPAALPQNMTLLFLLGMAALTSVAAITWFLVRDKKR